MEISPPKLHVPIIYFFIRIVSFLLNTRAKYHKLLFLVQTFPIVSRSEFSEFSMWEEKNKILPPYQLLVDYLTFHRSYKGNDFHNQS